MVESVQFFGPVNDSHAGIGFYYMYTVQEHIIQIGYNFFHVFCKLTGLLRTDATYSCVSGDQGGIDFFHTWGFFFGAHL